jgi:hypothetical protein
MRGSDGDRGSAVADFGVDLGLGIEVGVLEDLVATAMLYLIWGPRPGVAAVELQDQGAHQEAIDRADPSRRIGKQHAGAGFAAG